MSLFPTFLRRSRWFLGTAALGLALLCGSACAFESGPVLRLGLSTVAMPATRDPLENATLEAFERAFGRERLFVRTYPVLELEKAIRSGEIDLFLGSAGLSRRVADTGARPLVTSVRPGLEDPNRNEGSLFIVRRDAPIQNIDDMRGRRLAANLPYGFSGYHAALGEIAARGYDPSDFFSSSIFFGKSAAMPDIARAVRNGDADVGILRLCAYEGLRVSDPELVAALRPLPPERPVDGKVACLHSTRLYPAQTISVMPSVSPEDTKALLVSLLTLTAQSGGRSWSVATDFKAVDELLASLSLGPYARPEPWTLERFLRRYWPHVAVAAGLLAALLLHAWRADVLVRRREEELHEAAERERAQRDRIETLQRAGVVGQLSSLIAHEIHQPLAAIRLFADGLVRRASQGSLSMEKIISVGGHIAHDAERARAVVDRVREYARERQPAKEPVDLAHLTAHLRETYPALFAKSGAPTPTESNPLWVYGRPIELELVIVNLLRNAVEAASHAREPAVTVRTFRDGHHVVLTIQDNGPRVSDEVFSRLTEPVTSSKPEGLGLGLAIVRGIVENHEGSIAFERLEPDGILCRLTFPALEASDPSENVISSETAP